MKKIRGLTAAFLALCLVLSALSGCTAAPGPDISDNEIRSTDEIRRDAEENTVITKRPADREGIVKLTSYSDVYEFIKDYGYSYGAIYDDMNWKAEEASGTAESEPESAAMSDGANYSGTNVQTDGIDEGDTVKTDGEYIYILKDSSEVIILRAAGADTEKVAEINVSEDFHNEDNKYYSGHSAYASQIYVCGDKLAVLKNVHDWSEKKLEGDYQYKYIDENRASVEIYDITDRAAPKPVNTLSQDGSICDSRLDGDTLYLVSSYWVYNCSETDEETYIPSVKTEAGDSLIAIDDICIPINCGGTGWSVVSAIDISTGEMKASKATLGGASRVYMSAENIYVVSSSYRSTESEPRTEDQYEVRDHEDGSYTDIVKYSTSGGTLDYERTASIPGYTESQFSLDEYGGNLRVVVTENSYKYTTYYDKKHEFINTKYGENRMCNSLYVLGPELNIIGSVTELAEDERVYSARFDGDVAYFVTFRETDPLFAVDLSDPTNPTVLSALKIPGFSEYLHKFTDGRLFGLGMNVNENGGWTEGLKLAMFDITDPADVRELNTAVLKQYWSDALYDHHAVFVDGTKNLIAFQADEVYMFFSYADDSGFRNEKSLELAELGTWGIRGMYIGDSFYVCSGSGVAVLDLATLSETARISLF